MTKSRSIFRKWLDPNNEFIDNFIKIQPDGEMLQIYFAKDKLGEKVRVHLTSPKNNHNQEVFERHKQVCSKEEWEKAQERAKLLVRGISFEE